MFSVCPWASFERTHQSATQPVHHTELYCLLATHPMPAVTFPSGPVFSPGWSEVTFMWDVRFRAPPCLLPLFSTAAIGV